MPPPVYLPPTHTHSHVVPTPRCSACANTANRLDVFVCVCVTLMVSSIELTQMDLQMHYIITSGLHHQPFTFLLNDKRDFHRQSRPLYFPLCSLFYMRLTNLEVCEINGLNGLVCMLKVLCCGRFFHSLVCGLCGWMCGLYV